ncbi:MAG: rhomboid family intramembrane serine protease [Candidatus Azobacteroides sp.]|nr:rhomboid family intramembrane serine protease [Candidatus Azobacteroides sp.]
MKVEIKRILYAFLFPCLFVFVLWLILLLEKGLNADWYRLGIYPRNEFGLGGILTAPLMHSGWRHLFSNSIPLIVLGWCLFYFYNEIGLLVALALWILSGAFTWCIGRESWHIGASGLIYAFSFFLFFSGIFRKYISLMAVSLLVVFLYGGMWWSMFPVAQIVDPSISWEGHLSGVLSGLLCAVVFRKYGPQKPEEEEEEEEDEDTEE